MSLKKSDACSTMSRSSFFPMFSVHLHTTALKAAFTFFCPW